MGSSRRLAGLPASLRMVAQEERGGSRGVSQVQADRKHVPPIPGGQLTHRAPPRPRPAATCNAKLVSELAAAARGLGLRGRPLAVPTNREAACPRGPRSPSVIGRLSPASGRAVNQRAGRRRLTLAVPLRGRAACRVAGRLGSRQG